MTVKIRLRRGTATQWTSANTILAPGEAGYETDTGKIKYGNGTDAWTALPYFLGNVDNTSNVTERSAAATLTNKTISGANNTITNLGVAAIGASGTPSSTNYLRGDGTWSTVGTTRVSQTYTAGATIGAEPNTEYFSTINISGVVDGGMGNVVGLLHLNGTNNSTVIVDNSKYASNWTANGNAKIATAASKFGGASAAFDGQQTSFLHPAIAASNFEFGTGDFTIEMFAISGSYAGNQMVYDGRPSVSENGNFPSIYCWNRGYGGPISYGYFTNGGASIGVAGGDSYNVNNAWTHIAVCRSAGTLRFFINGTAIYAVADSTNYLATTAPKIGNGLVGYVDEVRITRAARYTASFTAPTAQFPDAGPVTLPSAINNTNRYFFYNSNAASTLIGTSSGQSINGLAQYTLNSNALVECIANGSNWYAR